MICKEYNTNRTMMLSAKNIEASFIGVNCIDILQATRHLMTDKIIVVQCF